MIGFTKDLARLRQRSTIGQPTIKNSAGGTDLRFWGPPSREDIWFSWMGDSDLLEYLYTRMDAIEHLVDVGWATVPCVTGSNQRALIEALEALNKEPKK